MTATDTGMRFWLRYVEQAGGLCEDAGDSALVVLPDHLQDEHTSADVVRVTAEPDVAREDGATLLLSGHPWLVQAAESVIGQGDCGLVRLPRPSGATPGSDQLLAAAREQFPVDHGRIDATGGAAPGVRPVVRVGALVTYTVSSDVTFQEQIECWVDVVSRLELADEVVDRLARLVDVEHPERTAEQPPTSQLVQALHYAHERIDARAARRAPELTQQVAQERDREVARAVAYYADALGSLQRRLDSAPPDRAATLSAKIETTHAERDRRLAEIAEKYCATRTIRPFRLHVLAVPVLRLPVDVRRGERRYPLALDWLMPARRFALVRCPACGSAAPLAAAKTGLGCQDCLRKPEPRHRTAGLPVPPTAAAPAPPPVVAPPPPRERRPQQPVGDSTLAGAPRSQNAIQKAGGKLATSVWDLAVARDRRVQRLYAPHSPAAALHTLFGASGPLRAIGVDADEVPRSMTASDSEPPRVVCDLLLIDGEVQTATRRYGYQLCWRFVGNAALIEEITPFDGAGWPRQPEPRFYPAGLPGRRLYANTPPPRAEFDLVGAQLWRSLAMNGLPLTLRAFAAWWRIGDADELLTRHSPEALAAAIIRAVAYRAGVGGRYDDVADAFRVEVAAVRAAASDVQRRVRLAQNRPW
jgi:hypothetical protein